VIKKIKLKEKDRKNIEVKSIKKNTEKKNISLLRLT
jgi:hypothetical protein